VALLVARLEVVPTGVSQCKVPKILMLNFKWHVMSMCQSNDFGIYNYNAGDFKC
jgi:hypothetical protein